MPLTAQTGDIPELARSAYIQLAGTFDAVAASNFSQLVRQLVDKEQRRFFILDLANVVEGSPEAVAALLALSRDAKRQGGDLALVNPSQAIVGVMRQLNVGHSFTFFLDYRNACVFLQGIEKPPTKLDVNTKAGEPSSRVKPSGITGLHTPPTSPMVPTPPGGLAVLLMVTDGAEMKRVIEVAEETLKSFGAVLTVAQPGFFKRFDEALLSVERSQVVVVDFSPRVPTQDPYTEVLTVAAIARLKLPGRVLIISQHRTPPPMWSEMPFETYHAGKNQVKELGARLAAFIHTVLPKLQ